MVVSGYLLITDYYRYSCGAGAIDAAIEN